VTHDRDLKLNNGEGGDIPPNNQVSGKRFPSLGETDKNNTLIEKSRFSGGKLWRELKISQQYLKIK
jgi:hypothetical protein